MSAEKFKKLLEIGRQLAETRELDPLLESATSMALSLVGAEFGYVVLLDKGADDYVFRVGQDKDGNRLPEPREQVSRTILRQVIRDGRGAITEDALSSLKDASSVLKLRLRSVICAPLISRGEILGAVYVENRSASNLFHKEDLELLEYFAAQAAVSIENAILNENLEARVRERTLELEEANKKLRELAITDSLTGTFNRRYFFELATQELAKARRYNESLSAIMLDLDYFKRVNDQYGHIVGDRVLQAAAQSIRENIRAADVLGRYGGEEFAILLPNTPLPGAREIAERVCKVIAGREVRAGEALIRFTASLGVTHVGDATKINVEGLFDRADQALYAAKQSGRNRVAVWEESA